MLGADINFFRGGHGHFHWTRASAANAVASCGRLRFSMSNGDFALEKIGDAERVAECLVHFFKFENFLRIGFFVDAMQAHDSAAIKITRDALIRSEHEFLDDAVRDITLAAQDAGHAALRVEFDYALG